MHYEVVCDLSTEIDGEYILSFNDAHIATCWYSFRLPNGISMFVLPFIFGKFIRSWFVKTGFIRTFQSLFATIVAEGKASIKMVV